MFARLIEFTPKLEKKDDFFKTLRMEILPILRKQDGFLEFIPFVPETKNDKIVCISLWAEKVHADKYVKNAFPKVEQIVRPFQAAPVNYRMFNVETMLCERLVEHLTAVA